MAEVKKPPMISKEVIISESALAPIEEKNKFMLVKSPITNAQVLQIFSRTPEEHIYRRPGKGGRDFDYVTGTYIKKVLNYTFGWLWDFQVIDKGREGNQIWVLGRLTIKNEKLETIVVKEQFGRSDIKLLRGTKDAVDYGNDLKAAATDALKKCASELGIASDIYGASEFKEIGQKQPVERKTMPKPVKLPPTPTKAETDPILKIKDTLHKLGAKNEKEALALLYKKTKVNWGDFKNQTPKMCELVLKKLLNS